MAGTGSVLMAIDKGNIDVKDSFESCWCILARELVSEMSTDLFSKLGEGIKVGARGKW